MERVFLTIALIAITALSAFSQENNKPSRKWGAEVNLLWPIYPGNIYKGQVTYETWRKDDLAGDVFVGLTIRPFEFREAEGDFANYALTFGYRQFVWKGLHIELYNAFGPGFNRNNAVDGKDYSSWDYEVGVLAGYRWEFIKKEKREKMKFSPYLSTQHGTYYVASKSNPHPIIGSTEERPIYVGTLNLGIRF
ncbi:MAG: hypothetical protein ACK5CV_04530 [Bacteroidota bacterium]|jgi:hypothetical protein